MSLRKLQETVRDREVRVLQATGSGLQRVAQDRAERLHNSTLYGREPYRSLQRPKWERICKGLGLYDTEPLCCYLRLTQHLL